MVSTVSTHLKNISQIGLLPQIGMKIKHIWNHHLVFFNKKQRIFFGGSKHRKGRHPGLVLLLAQFLGIAWNLRWWLLVTQLKYTRMMFVTWWIVWFFPKQYEQQHLLETTKQLYVKTRKALIPQKTLSTWQGIDMFFLSDGFVTSMLVRQKVSFKNTWPQQSKINCCQGQWLTMPGILSVKRIIEMDWFTIVSKLAAISPI